MNIQKRRAQFALGKITAHQNEDGRDKYKTELLKLPARLHTNGFGQTVAFYLSAGSGKPAWEICGWLAAWLRETEIYPGQKPLIEALTEAGGDSEARYRQAAAEARELAVWLKRFAEAFL